MAVIDVNTIRSQFPILSKEVNGKPLIYLDSAATSLKPQVVIDRLMNYYMYETANVHRGVHFLSEQATQYYEEARDKVQTFINASSRKEIVFTHGTTESINVIARSLSLSYLKANDIILVSEMEHHSNFVPWQMVAKQVGAKIQLIPLLDDGQLDLVTLKEMLTPQVKLLAITYVSNALGTINPLETIIDMAHQVGTLVVVDAAQAVTELTIDVQKLDCDFLAFSGHKMYSPEGVGVLYGKENILNELPPVCGGGDMILKVQTEKTTFNELPYKFEAGTPNIGGVIALGTAIDWMQSIDKKWLKDHKQQLLYHATKELSEISGIHILAKDVTKTAIVSFILEGVHPHDMGSLLDQDGIAVRTGHHCSQFVMNRFCVPATTRLSFSVFNTIDEVNQTMQSIKKIRKMML